MINVIIFEDNYINAFALELMIKQMNLNSLGFYDSADEITSLFNANKIDFILMDIELKGELSGIDAAKELRKFSNVPMIFLSGNSSSAVIAQTKSIRNSSFISKPYTENALRDKFIEFGVFNRTQ